jgi:8-amino-7-oxononanoate synthase|tara:strand:+ start:3722 stop:4903 length:1182 start_codon:yes stop_codon:yes gene_type:complete
VASLPWSRALAATLAERQSSGRYRRLRTRSGEQGVSVIIDGKEMLSFCSNDYLGLAAHPTITKAFINAAETEGVGSGAAHLLGGHSSYHQQLEEALADFMGQQSVLLFSSGYQANLGVIDGLMSRGDVVIQDKLNHASLLDGGRLSAAKSWRYHHADMGSLQRRLSQTEGSACRLVVTDGVFSMDGDLAPLGPLLQLTQTHQAALMVDDAHAIGVLGKHGRGSVEHWQVKADHMPIVMGTLGKAFGTAGAFVAADKDVIETLIQQSRTFVYTTAQPAAVAAASLASLVLVKTENWRREKLQTLIEQFRKGAAELGLATLNSLTPIQPIMIGDDKRAMKIGQELESRGFLLGVIRTPTVPLGSARLRVTLSTNHTEQNIKQLLEALEDVICTSQ